MKTKDEILSFKTQFNKLTRARTPYQLEYFAIKKHAHPYMQWRQLLIEASDKYKALQNAEYSIEMGELEIQELELKLVKPKETDKSGYYYDKTREIENKKIKLEIHKKRNDLENLRSAMTGALKELSDLITIAKRDYAAYLLINTEEKLDDRFEKIYWKNRLANQIQVDLITSNHISEGNLAWLKNFPQTEQHDIILESLELVDSHNRKLAQIGQEFDKILEKRKKELSFRSLYANNKSDDSKPTNK